MKTNFFILMAVCAFLGSESSRAQGLPLPPIPLMHVPGGGSKPQPVSNTKAPGGKTQCLIRVVAKHPSCLGARGNDYYKVNAAFQDTDTIANNNAGRCIERALEYANWCGDANLKTTGAYAYFVVEGRAMINSYATTATQKTILGDGISRVLRFKD